MFVSLIFGFCMVCRQYHGLIIKGHFGFERFILLLRVDESIVRPFSPWIWETYWEWGLGFLCSRFLGSLSISPLPSYSDLLWFGVLRMSCSSLSHIAIFVSQLVSPFSSTPIHHSSCPFSSASILVDRRFTSWTMSSLVRITYCLFFIWMQGWVTLLTWFCDVWHCAHRGLALSIGIFGPLFPIVSFTFYPWPTLRSES